MILNIQYQKSLHHIGKMNEYEMAIRSVGDVLSNYDSDKLFPGKLN